MFLLYRSWSRVAAAQDPISCYSLHVEGYEAVNLLVIYVLQLLKLLFHVVHVLQLLKVTAVHGILTLLFLVDCVLLNYFFLLLNHAAIQYNDAYDVS